MLSSEEYRYLFQIGRTYGYSCDEFEISNFYFIKKNGTVCTSLTTVIIRHIRLNISRKYMSGCGFYWFLAFENDLEAGRFRS